MNTSHNLPREQYAIIQVQQSEGGIERFVMAYNNERSLREFLAKRCIVAIGFSSRVEAAKSAFMTATADHERLSRIMLWAKIPLTRLRLFMTRCFSRQFSPTEVVPVQLNIARLATAAISRVQLHLMHALRRLEPAELWH